MRLLPAAGYKRMPWKNGGGETTEIATFPEAAGLDAFDWRVSMASVASDGPFSFFPGIDRTLTVLQGEGLSLTIDGREPRVLTPSSLPLSFAGDATTSARLLGGPILDLNVMTRRARFSHTVQPLGVEDTLDLEVEGSTVLLCLSGAVEVTAAIRLGLFDAVVTDNPFIGSWHLRADQPARLLLVTFAEGDDPAI